MSVLGVVPCIRFVHPGVRGTGTVARAQAPV